MGRLRRLFFYDKRKSNKLKPFANNSGFGIGIKKPWI